MPRQGLSGAEIDDLVAFFRWVGGGEVNNNDWPPQDSGKRLTRGEQRMVASVGVSPGAAMSKDEIAGYIRDPKAVNPDTMMPAQKDNLTERELEEVARFLSTRK